MSAGSGAAGGRGDEHHTDENDGSRNEMCEREGAGDASVDANEFDGKTQRPCQHEVPAEYVTIREPSASPSDDRPRDQDEPRRLVQLCRMYRNVSRRQPSWKGDAPRKIGRTSIIIANQKTSDSANRMADGERRCRRRERRHNRDASPVQGPCARAHPADEPPEPAQPAAAQQERQKRSLVAKFNRPNDLGANEPSDDADQCSVHTVGRQTTAQQLAVKDPESGKCAERHHDAECRDFKFAEAYKRWIHAISDHSTTIAPLNIPIPQLNVISPAF